MSNKYPGGIITSGANAGYSVAFDGTGDYLQAGSNAALAPGSGNFTLEFFVYPVGSANFMGLYQNYTDGLSRSTAFRISINGTDNTSLVVQTQASALITTSTGVMTANAWNHVALVRNGSGSNNLVLYVNGVSRGTATNTTNFSDGFAQIGNTIYNGTNYTWNGYISNFRLVVGTALYTAAFTPPTQLFAITNTSLLTCNSPAIVDQSSNAFTITANGNAAVSTFTPFQGYTAYNPALGAATPGIWTVSDAIQAAQTRRWNMYDPYFNYTTLLLHGNGTNGAQNNTFLDSSSNNFTITRNGNTTQGTFSPFSQTGWSNYFPNTYLSAAANNAFSFGTGNFTIETWVYPTVGGVYRGLFANGGIATGSFAVYLTNTNTVRLDYYNGGGLGTTTTVALNTWSHIVVARSGSTISIFINGTREATTTTSDNNTTNACYIGASWGGASDYMQGYMSNLRIVKGTAVYDPTQSTLTVPTAPLTAVTNTSLLTCQSNRFVDNSSNAFAITVNGTPSVQAFSPFYPLVAYTPQAQGGSGYFDGTGDYLTTVDNAAFQLGSGNFCIEAWFYPTSTGDQVIVSKWGSPDSNSAYEIIYFSQVLYCQVASSSTVTSLTTSITTANWPINRWNHIAFVRSGNTISAYLNGARFATNAAYSSTINAGNNGVSVGVRAGGSSYPFAGYISNARIVKGSSIYDPSQSTITIPTAPFANVTNTSLLLNFTNAGIVDSTAKNVLETVGNAQISTTQSKFGGSSMYFDGTGDGLLLRSSDIVAVGSGDFTMEAWINPSSQVNSFGTIFGSGAAGGPILTLRGSGTASSISMNPYGSADIFNYSYTFTTGAWYHIAVSRGGTSLRVFINGTQLSTTVTNSTNWGACTVIGGVDSGATQNYTGYIDDLRITKGYARYTGNFTPQTSQWQDQ